MLIWTLAATLGAAPCERLDLDAEIGADLREIHGSVTCVGSGAAAFDVALYPNLLRSPAGLDDINRAWFYPAGFDAALIRVAQDGREQPTERIWLRVDSGGNDVTLEFATRVPRRNGTFGVASGVAYLLGGWHPVFARDRRLQAQPIRYRVRVPPGVVGFVGATPVGRSAARDVEGTAFGEFLPVLLAPAAKIVSRPSFVVVQPRSGGEHRPFAAADDLQDVTASLDDGALLRLEETLAAGDEFAIESGVGPRARLVVVVAPLRESLVEPFDGGLAVSDRAFHLLGFERLLQFHRLSIWREQLAARALPACRAQADLFPEELCADAVGAALRDRLGRSRYGRKESAADLLETFAVIPEIDALIFAPQVAFATTYFDAIDESPKRRWRLDNFDTELPRGKLLYEKLVDRLGAAAVATAVDRFTGGEASLWQAVASVAGADLSAWLSTWLGPTPRVDYRLGAITHAAHATRVEVAATGPDAARVAETIEVEVVGADGKAQTVSRLGPGVVEVPGAAAPARVEIDPRGRLVELVHADGEAPRFNNRTPPRWRFLLNNITSLIAVTNRELTAAADFSLRRIYDLTWRSDFFALYSPTSVGLAAALSYSFGPEVTALHLAHRAGLSGGYERLRSDAGGGLPGDLGSMQLYYSYDDRLSPYWSFEGKGWSARLAGAYGVDTHGARHRFVQGGVSAFYIQPLAFGHALLARLRADFVQGDPPPQNTLRLGDRYRGARGFERDEVRGTRRVIGSAEYRHLLEGDGRTDFAGAATWSRFEGALFGDAVYLPVSRPGCRQSMFYDVGYGLRFIADVLGVSPAEVAIDLGVPIRRCADVGSRLPFSVYLAFEQSFAVF